MTKIPSVYIRRIAIIELDFKENKYRIIRKELERFWRKLKFGKSSRFP